MRIISKQCLLESHDSSKQCLLESHDSNRSGNHTNYGGDWNHVILIGGVIKAVENPDWNHVILIGQTKMRNNDPDWNHVIPIRPDGPNFFAHMRESCQFP